MSNKTLIIVLLTAISVWLSPQPLAAQRMGGGGHFGFSHSGAPFPNGGFAGGRQGYGRYGLYSGLLYSDLFYGDMLDAGYPVASQPPLVIMQSPPASPPAAPAPPLAAAQPLMFELQGNHYVRVSGEGGSGSQMLDADDSAPQSFADSNQPARKEPVTALLVFRDGHEEQIRDYTITNGTLYAGRNSDSGLVTTQTIELSSLDLPATIKSNRDRGIDFQLPAAPNVVMVGP